MVRRVQLKIKFFQLTNVLVLNQLVPTGEIAGRNEAKCSLSKICLFSFFFYFESSVYFRTCRTRGPLKYKLSSVESLIKKVTQQIMFCYSCNFILVKQTVILHKNTKFDKFSFPGTILGNMTARFLI